VQPKNVSFIDVSAKCLKPSLGLTLGVGRQ